MWLWAGVVVGFLLGWIISRLIARVDDYLIETTLTTVLAFGSYLAAERLGFSGVLAVVVAGLVNGNIGPQGMSPTTRIVLFNFWEYVAFLANSIVFLLIGLEVDLPTMLGSWQPILWGILSVLIARSLVVYGLSWIGSRLTDPIPLRWQHVMNWGGLRGAISLALALSLPAALGTDRNMVRIMAFGVVLFTLLVQGTTMKPLLRLLRVVTRDPTQVEYETRHARLMAFRAAATHLDNMHRDGFLSEHAWDTLRPELLDNAGSLAGAVRDLLRTNPELAEAELENARRELLRAQRGRAARVAARRRDLRGGVRKTSLGGGFRLGWRRGTRKTSIRRPNAPPPTARKRADPPNSLRPIRAPIGRSGTVAGCLGQSHDSCSVRWRSDVCPLAPSAFASYGWMM